MLYVFFFKYFNQDQKFIKKNNNYLDAKEQKKIEEIRLSRKEQGYREIEIQDELARIIETILNSLKGNRRRIFLYLIGGITQKEVSDKLGITHQRVSQIKMAAMKELKLAMSDIEDNTEKIFSFKIKYCKFKLGILIKSQYLQEEVIKLFSNKFHTEQRKNKIIIEGALEDKTFLFLADIMLNLENIL